MIDFLLDKEDRTRPLYLQLAERFESAIAAGDYSPGDQLPTENELRQTAGVSKGTIKSAYTHLQNMGIVRKIRGSGVYVKEYGEADQSPHAIIEELFNKLTRQYGMSVSDAYRLFREQLELSYAESDLVNVTLVDCNAETISILQKQLEHIPGLSLTTILFNDLLFTGKAMLDPGCELVITTQLHYPGVCRYTEPLKIPTEPFALMETKETLVALSKLQESQRVCVVYRSDAFLSSVRYTWRLLKKRGQIIPCREDDMDTLNRHGMSGMPFLVAPDYMEHSSSQTLQAVFRARAAGSAIIPICFEVDQGSILHLTQLIEGIRERKRRYP